MYFIFYLFLLFFYMAEMGLHTEVSLTHINKNKPSNSLFDGFCCQINPAKQSREGDWKLKLVTYTQKEPANCWFFSWYKQKERK